MAPTGEPWPTPGDLRPLTNALKNLRVQAGTPTITQIARMSGIAQSTVHAALTGKYLYKRSVLDAILATLAADADEHNRIRQLHGFLVEEARARRAQRKARPIGQRA
ncbi:helix-turn-helix transcriptional regulator [Streptomyces sp. NPDC046197]|uniref:helix-turn-helix domain-containing protein n=1 Tax=Streptomyces sp. NPDC046197 TaxID=3154337 RepID=UPI003408E74D